MANQLGDAYPGLAVSISAQNTQYLEACIGSNGFLIKGDLQLRGEGF